MPAERPDAAAIEATILRLVEAAGGKSISPTDVARDLDPGPQFHMLMGAVRRAAVKLALAGSIVITRKGKPVDPTDFKGVYRLGPGNNTGVRPVSQ
ncbi:MAG TPA: DUF3253 domain-containing protein [Pseudolabrys sp.]|nr:DUF3253 domain-containing protein [Pseudolabrys sp.]